MTEADKQRQRERGRCVFDDQVPDLSRAEAGEALSQYFYWLKYYYAPKLTEVPPEKEGRKVKGQRSLIAVFRRQRGRYCQYLVDEKIMTDRQRRSLEVEFAWLDQHLTIAHD